MNGGRQPPQELCNTAMPDAICRLYNQVQESAPHYRSRVWQLAGLSPEPAGTGERSHLRSLDRRHGTFQLCASKPRVECKGFGNLNIIKTDQSTGLDMLPYDGIR